MKHKKAIIVSISLILLFIIIAIAVIKLKSSGENVSLDTVKNGKLQKTLSITGEVVSNNTFETLLNSSLKVTSLNFKEGDIIKKGDTILTYDSSDIENQLNKAKLNLDYQKEILESAKAQSEEKSNADLPKEATDKLSSDEIKEILNSVNKTPEINTKAQDLQIEMAENDIESLKKKLDSYKLKSPINGKITKLSAKKGSMPAQGSALQITDTSNLKIKLSLSQYDSALIKKGQPVNIKISGIDDKLLGTVSYVSDVAETNDPTSTEKSILCYVTLDGDTSILKIGFEAECSIILDEKTANYVSFDSIKKDKTGKYVYIVKENKAYKKYVKTGLETDFEVEVLDGLKKGESYIKNPSEALKEGSPVKVSKGDSNA